MTTTAPFLSRIQPAAPVDANEAPDDEGRARESFLVKPDALAQLVKLWGTARVGEETGYAQATIANSLRENQCRYTLELVSKFLLERENQVTYVAPAHVLCTVPDTKFQAFMTVALAMGIKTTPLEV